MDCDKLLGRLPSVQWAKPVVAMATGVMDAATAYLANRFPRIVSSEKFLQLGKVCQDIFCFGTYCLI